MTYELALFDLGGVAVETTAERMVNQMSQLLGRSIDEVQQAVYDPELLLPFELGRIRPQAYYEGLRARLGLSWTYEQFARSWNDIFTENRDVVSIMQRLHRRHKLMALSNTNELHLHHIRTTIPSLIIFDDWIASCDVGFRKPDPEIYRIALRRGGVRPQAAIYVDDRPELVEAGRAIGLTAIRFENSQQLEQDLQAIGMNV
jgi:putative hydrolase of the HAD superfamily